MMSYIILSHMTDIFDELLYPLYISEKDIVLNMVRMAVLGEEDDVSGGPDLTSRPPSRCVCI